MRWRRLSAVLVLILINAAVSVTLAQDITPTIDISATTIEFNAKTNTVTASGSLIIVYNEYEFTADELEYIEHEGKAHLKGKVVVAYGEESRIEADEVIFYTSSEKLVAYGKNRMLIRTPEIVVHAKELEFEMTTRRATMKGDVSVLAGDISAECQKLDALEDVLVLSDKATVVQNGRRFSADEIVVHLDEKRIVAKGNSRMLID
jgi:lipopolysaccharide export system protein LptA